MTEERKFSWPGYPTNQDEFERLMRAIDQELADRGRPIQARPLLVGRLFWEAFGWGGNMLPPKVLAKAPGFTGEVLIAKANEWYSSTYGSRLNVDHSFGYFPYRFNRLLWRAGAYLFYGTIRYVANRDLSDTGLKISSRGPVDFNVLLALDGLPQGMLKYVEDAEIIHLLQIYPTFHRVLMWWHGIVSTSGLLTTAKADYDACTEDVLGKRYAQARWDAQQAVEKAIKGILRLAGIQYPTGGPKGHDLLHLADLLAAAGPRLDVQFLRAASCSAGVRYGDTPSTESEAYSANHAVLWPLEQLSRSARVKALVVSNREP